MGSTPDVGLFEINGSSPLPLNDVGQGEGVFAEPQSQTAAFRQQTGSLSMLGTVAVLPGVVREGGNWSGVIRGSATNRKNNSGFPDRATVEARDKSVGKLAVEAVSGGIEVFEQLVGEWQQMLEQVQDDPLFWRPEWILASLRAYSPAAKLLVVTVRRQGELCALLPLVEEQRMFAGLPARKLRPPMTTPGVGIDILCTRGGLGQGDPVGAIWQFLKQRKGWDVLELPSVFQGAAIERLVELACKDGHSTGSWPLTLIVFFASPQGLDPSQELDKYPRHPKLRSKVRQREAKLAALGTVRLRRVESAGSRDLQCFYEMEARGWKGREKSAIISDPRSRQFFDAVVSEAERLGYLCLYLLELDGKPIAAHIGFTYHGRYWAAKSTYDEDYRDYAPGHLIVKAILRDLVGRGISEYVMGVREDWKMEWTQDVRRRSCQCVFASGLWARALYTARFPLRRRLREIRSLRETLPAYLRRLPAVRPAPAARASSA